MLVLTRREGEAIVIDGDIRVVVLASDHRGVKLGIEAPQGRAILREELVVAVAKENRRAAASEVEWADTLVPAVIQPKAAG